MADIVLPRTREYKDLSLSFGRNPVTHDVISVSGEEAVKRSIKNLLMTRTGEVPFFPHFGSQLAYLLFEPIDPITTARIESEIRATLEGFEPRIRIRSIQIVPTPDEHKYEVTLEFRIVNMLEPVTMTIFLTRLR